MRKGAQGRVNARKCAIFRAVDSYRVVAHLYAWKEMARCVLYGCGLRPIPPTTVSYSPAARRDLALRGLSSLPHQEQLHIKRSAAMIGTGQQKTTARRRGKPIEVWVNDEEKAQINARAEQSGLSRSGYLRAVGLNYPIRSVLDLAAVADLAKVNGDLGRIAGLLKLWLTEKRGQGARAVDVDSMMVEFRELQGEVRSIMSKVVYDRS